MFRRLQIATAAAAALLLCTFPLFAKARTAWVWTTDGRPFSFLLAFALGALALETLLHRDDSPNPRLLAGLLAANAVSTAGIALLERLAFHGYWLWI